MTDIETLSATGEPEQWQRLEQVRDHWPTRELKLQAELARADEAAIKWHRKYEEIFQEQCQFRSVETQLRERLRIAEAAAAVKDAQWEIIEWLLKRLQEGSSTLLPR